MICNEDISFRLAEYLLQIKAIKLQPGKPFTWASGWKSPVYCDNRLSLSHPEIRNFIAGSMADYIREKLPETEAVAGVATGGIPHAAIVAHILQLPMIYVRSSPKSHGTQSQIEGGTANIKQAVVIEDLVSTGKSSLAAVSALRNIGIEVNQMLSVFDYGFPESENAFETEKVKLFSLGNFEMLLQVALKTGYIGAEELETIKTWRMAPSEWPEK